jgi:hypothetical protein
VDEICHVNRQNIPAVNTSTANFFPRYYEYFTEKEGRVTGLVTSGVGTPFENALLKYRGKGRSDGKTRKKT